MLNMYIALWYFELSCMRGTWALKSILCDPDGEWLGIVDTLLSSRFMKALNSLQSNSWRWKPLRIIELSTLRRKCDQDPTLYPWPAIHFDWWFRTTQELPNVAVYIPMALLCNLQSGQSQSHAITTVGWRPPDGPTQAPESSLSWSTSVTR